MRLFVDRNRYAGGISGKFLIIYNFNGLERKQWYHRINLEKGFIPIWGGAENPPDILKKSTSGFPIKSVRFLTCIFSLVLAMLVCGSNTHVYPHVLTAIYFLILKLFSHESKFYASFCKNRFKGIVKWQGRRGVSGINRIIMTSHTIADVF